MLRSAIINCLGVVKEDFTEETEDGSRKMNKEFAYRKTGVRRIGRENGSDKVTGVKTTASL